MKLLVTGAQGQLGREVEKQGCQHELILTDVHSLDISNNKAVRDCLQAVKPDAVIHCAAYTNVDGAESDEDNAFRVNVVGTQNIAAGCLDIGARMVYISTDYVFDGTKKTPYREFDMPNPQTVYGRTKWQGEEMVRQILGRHYILRTAWLYGDGNNFVKTMLKLAREGHPLRIVCDQIGSPTSTKDLTATIFALLNSDSYGTYHASCQGECSWYEFAREIFRQASLTVGITPVATKDFPRAAIRPLHSVLENYMLKMTIGDPMRDWQMALMEYLQVNQGLI